MTHESTPYQADATTAAINEVTQTLYGEAGAHGAEALSPQGQGELGPDHFAYTRNGLQVRYDPEGMGAHASTHFKDTPQLPALVKEIIEGLDADGTADIYNSFDMGRDVGFTDLVPTDATDTIVYAKRPHRDNYMRFSQSQGPVPCSLVTLILKIRGEGGALDLFSAWVGPATPGFPGTAFEKPESKDFWGTHALAWGTQEVDEASVTTERPW